MNLHLFFEMINGNTTTFYKPFNQLLEFLKIKAFFFSSPYIYVVGICVYKYIYTMYTPFNENSFSPY